MTGTLPCASVCRAQGNAPVGSEANSSGLPISTTRESSSALGGPARTGRRGITIPNSRRHVNGSTGLRPHRPSTGGMMSCSMSVKPQRRPHRPPRPQASGGRQARRRAHEGARVDLLARSANAPAATSLRCCRAIRAQGQEASSDRAMTMYKGHELEAVSYEDLNTGRWIPVVHITYPKGTRITTLPLADLDHE